MVLSRRKLASIYTANPEFLGLGGGESAGLWEEKKTGRRVEGKKRRRAWERIKREGIEVEGGRG